AAAVLEDHDAGGLVGVVLLGHVDPVVAHGVGEDLALPLVLRDGALRHVVVGNAVGAVVVVLDADGGGAGAPAAGLVGVIHLAGVGQVNEQHVQVGPFGDRRHLPLPVLAVGLDDARGGAAEGRLVGHGDGPADGRLLDLRLGGAGLEVLLAEG